MQPISFDQRVLAILFLAVLILASCFGNEIYAEQRVYLPLIATGATPTLRMSATSGVMPATVTPEAPHE